MEQEKPDFIYQADRFADIRILRFQVPGFEGLTVQQKILLYFLSEAALSGRDIIWDQNYRYNLLIRYVLEKVYHNLKTEAVDNDHDEFLVYLKRIWFSNGIHHHYSTDKIIPGFSGEFLALQIRSLEWNELSELFQGQNELIAFIIPILFDPSVAAKRVSQDSDKDLVAGSANNYYQGITQPEAESFYTAKLKNAGKRPVSCGLNSRLVKENGKPVEKIWKAGGLYSGVIEKVVYWLTRALPFFENSLQRESVNKLIEYYQTGDLKLFDEYNILWVKEQDAQVDFINGFIETYGDPLGFKGSWEALVNFRNIESTKRTEVVCKNAQWFEDHSPVNERFKKKQVQGMSAKVITAVQLGGDCYPATPIGINLPNADWIRQEYGSKSVTIENITHAYHQASLESGLPEEFCNSEEEILLDRKWGFIADNLHTDLHECLGHGSGQLLPGVSTDTLRNYYSPMEEARADLYALYFIMDKYLEKLGIVPSEEVPRTLYNSYIRNGLVTQLVRIEPGKDIEQAHMRCRQLITSWCYEKGKTQNVIEKYSRNGKTYVRINDYSGLRQLFAQLLAEIQRIKSEGDYEAARNLIESYAIKVDRKLHTEVLSRYKKLNLAPYTGFLNPELIPVLSNGEIVDIEITYPQDYSAQMLKYSGEYSFLKLIN